LKRSAQTPAYMCLAPECAIAPQPACCGCGVYGKRNEDGGVPHLCSANERLNRP
jgi:hypothetical protein